FPVWTTHTCARKPTSFSEERTGSKAMSVVERHDQGVLDTCVVIDLGDLDPGRLPRFPDITSVTMAELHPGVATAKEPEARAQRMERLQAVVRDFSPLPFDDEARSEER